MEPGKRDLYRGEQGPAARHCRGFSGKRADRLPQLIDSDDPLLAAYARVVDWHVQTDRCCAGDKTANVLEHAAAQPDDRDVGVTQMLPASVDDGAHRFLHGDILAQEPGYTGENAPLHRGADPASIHWTRGIDVVEGGHSARPPPPGANKNSLPIFCSSTGSSRSKKIV